MSWIPIVPRADATGEVAAAYDEVAGARGAVANILAVHGVHPPTMRAHLALYRSLMFSSSSLSRAERETIAVAVSTGNGCRY